MCLPTYSLPPAVKTKGGGKGKEGKHAFGLNQPEEFCAEGELNSSARVATGSISTAA